MASKVTDYRTNADEDDRNRPTVAVGLGEMRARIGQPAHNAVHTQNCRSTDLNRGHGGHEGHPPGPAVMQNGQSTADRLAYTGQSMLAIATVDSKGTTVGTTQTDSDHVNLMLTKSINDPHTDSGACVHDSAESCDSAARPGRCTSS